MQWQIENGEYDRESGNFQAKILILKVWEPGFEWMR